MSKMHVPKGGANSIVLATGRMIRGQEAAQFVSTTLWYTFFFFLSPECDREVMENLKQ